MLDASCWRCLHALSTHLQPPSARLFNGECETGCACRPLRFVALPNHGSTLCFRVFLLLRPRPVQDGHAIMANFPIFLTRLSAPRVHQCLSGGEGSSRHSEISLHPIGADASSA